MRSDRAGRGACGDIFSQTGQERTGKHKNDLLSGTCKDERIRRKQMGK